MQWQGTQHKCTGPASWVSGPTIKHRQKSGLSLSWAEDKTKSLVDGSHGTPRLQMLFDFCARTYIDVGHAIFPNRTEILPALRHQGSRLPAHRLVGLMTTVRCMNSRIAAIYAVLLALVFPCRNSSCEEDDSCKSLSFCYEAKAFGKLYIQLGSGILGNGITSDRQSVKNWRVWNQDTVGLRPLSPSFHVAFWFANLLPVAGKLQGLEYFCTARIALHPPTLLGVA